MAAVQICPSWHFHFTLTPLLFVYLVGSHPYASFDSDWSVVFKSLNPGHACRPEQNGQLVLSLVLWATEVFQICSLEQIHLTDLLLPADKVVGFHLYACLAKSGWVELRSLIPFTVFWLLHKGQLFPPKLRLQTLAFKL